MKRQLLEKLICWKNSKDRKPLVLSGARQAGKTWLMKEFGRTEYKKTAYVSFFGNESLKKVFELDFDVKRIIANIEVYSNTNITEEDTLIILDEIQECPKALESLKNFCEMGAGYHIIVAGSLLGVTLHSGISYPVGKVNEMILYPLNFIEFLEAVGETNLSKYLIEKNSMLITDLNEKYFDLLKNYFFVGGMPNIVKTYIETHDYDLVREKQVEILNQYSSDFSKHINGIELFKTFKIFDQIPAELLKENKKFIFANIKKGARYKEYEMSIEWLKKSGIIYVVNRLNEVKIPLKAYKEDNAFKIFMVDIGLLCAMCEINKKTIYQGNDLFIEFKGALAEQFVAQQLISYCGYKPFYFMTQDNVYEIDFVVNNDDNIIPIEVKSGKNLNSKSLNYFRKKYNILKSYKMSLNSYKDNENIINLPLFAVSFI